MFDFRERNVLVVGGTRGIGYVMALAFAKAGASVVATSRDHARVESTARELSAMGTDTLTIACDATDVASVDHLMTALGEHWKHIDVLINCQGIHHKVPSQDVTDAAFADVIAVNVESVFRMCRGAFPLLKRAQGSIINIASMAAFLGLKHAAAYSASKGAVTQLTKTLAVDWAEYNIRVNAIAPGWIVTELSQSVLSQPAYRKPILKRIPLARLGQPEDVAGAALYLASDYARYVTGTVLVVDGGVLASV